VCFLSVARTALSARIRSAAPPKLADILEARASVAYQGDTEQRDEAVSERVQTEAETEPTGHQQIGRERIRCDQDDEGREKTSHRRQRRRLVDRSAGSVLDPRETKQ